MESTQSNPAQEDSQDHWRVRQFLNSKQTERSKVALIVIGLYLCMWFEFVDTWVIRDRMFAAWVVAAIVLNAVFFADMCAHIFVFGFG